ncbi:MAG: rhodanese-like domain-containing protein [Tannerella sp.]|jgi:rhodanese-related sulfurtransferase|nr:rhodanese-like domain-containing protein [Tannerella sp.]
MKALFMSIAFSLIACSCGTNAPKTGEATVKSVTAKEFRKLSTAGKGILLDVRTAEEFADGHIRGAQNIDVRSSDFEANIKRLPADKAILVYCRSGKRSLTAAEILSKNGFRKIVNLKGGIEEWNEAGFGTVK